MLFSSWNFIVYFLPVTLLVFYTIPARLHIWRKLWLILASLYFYGYWKLEYVPLLILSILGNYALAEGILRAGIRARFVLITGVSLNLLLLGYFKYTNFAIHFLSHIARRDLGHFNIALPLAISFFTFTQISYLVDVYRDRRTHYRFVDYSLFVLLFPHLIAGPIVRHWEIIPQFINRELKATRDNFGVGLSLFLFGLAKKYLADVAAFPADYVYNAAAQHLPVSMFDAWMGTLAFAIQIYFDFSGYSDMAIGLARLFGIKFPCNFDSPYRATSVIVFWERWHITLTRFLREYVYFNLGGNRRGHARQILNIMITMLLSGLWHGAGWTYVVWGGLHGIFLVVNHQWRLATSRVQENLNHWIYRTACVLVTFISVSFAWVFFRAPDIHVAAKVLVNMSGLHGFGVPRRPFTRWLWNSGPVGHKLLASLHVHFFDSTFNYEDNIGMIAALLLFCWCFPNTQQLLRRYDPVLEPVTRPSWFSLRLGFWAGLVFGFLAYLALRNSYENPPSPFIYFNF